MRRFIWLSQVVLMVAGVILVVTPPSFFPTYYRPTLMALTAFVYSFVIALSAFVFRIPSGAPDREVRLAARTRFQVALCIGFLLSGLGSLGLWGLYQVGIPYDRFVHFTFSALLMVFGSQLLSVWHGWSLKFSSALLFAMVVVFGVAWECVEFVSDRVLHFGYFGDLFDHDSLRDTLVNVAGAIFGAGVLACRKKKMPLSF